MTKRFYLSIARDFKDARPPIEAEQLLAVWMHCITITANHFALNNAMFNRTRFYEACGLVQKQPSPSE